MIAKIAVSALMSASASKVISTMTSPFAALLSARAIPVIHTSPTVGSFSLEPVGAMFAPFIAKVSRKPFVAAEVAFMSVAS